MRSCNAGTSRHRTRPPGTARWLADLQRAPTRGTDALLKESEEQYSECSACSRAAWREWPGEQTQMSQIVVGDLVRDDEAVESSSGSARQPTPEIDVAPGCSERREAVEPRDLDDEARGVRSILLESSRDSADPVGMKPFRSRCTFASISLCSHSPNDARPRPRNPSDASIRTFSSATG